MHPVEVELLIVLAIGAHGIYLGATPAAVERQSVVNASLDIRGVGHGPDGKSVCTDNLRSRAKW